MNAPRPHALLGLLLTGSIALGGFLVGVRPVHADPARPAVQKQISTGPDAPSASSMYETEALQNEQQGRWLGAVAAWRNYARVTPAVDGAWRKAMDRLHDLSGLSWSTPLKAREVLPVVVGKEVVAVPYRIKYGDGLRDVVTGIDPVSGRVLWTREDAVAYPYDGDVLVFVQNWEHVVRVDLKTGGDTWEYRFPPPDGDRVAGARNQPSNELRGEGPRKVLGLHGDTVILQGDTWPVCVDIPSGKVLWGPASEACKGYRARLTTAGVVAWPGDAKPKGMSDAQWQACQMVMLSFDDGHVLWKRPLVAGEPWYVSPGHSRLYVSDPNLQTEVGWTAIALDKGMTVWRQPHAEARPSVLVSTEKVLVAESPDGLENHTTRFMDPNTGKVLWQSDHVVKITDAGMVLEEEPGGPLQAREIATGQVLWSFEQTDDLHVDPYEALVDRNVYLPAHGPGPMSGVDTPGAIRASGKDGKVEWRHRAADTPYQQQMHTVAMAGDLVLLEQTMQINKPKLAERTPPNFVSSLVALDAGKGDVAWGFYDLQTVPSSPPQRVGNTLYVVGQDRDGYSVYSFDLTRIGELVKEGRRWWW
jgi:outer membrane protein assembly factor BamB